MTWHFRWALAEMMTQRGVRSAVQLHAALGHVGLPLSLSQVERLIAHEPQLLVVRNVLGLCHALDCEIYHLLVHEPNARPASAREAHDAAQPQSLLHDPNARKLPPPLDFGV